MVEIEEGEKIRIEGYLSSYVTDGESIGGNIDLDLNGNFRITAFVAVIIKEGTEFGGQFRSSEFPLYTDVTSSSIDELIDSLQDRIDDLFSPIEKRRYGNTSDERRTSLEQIIAVALSNTGAFSMQSEVELEKGYRIDIPLQVNGDYGVTITSVRNPRDEDNKITEQKQRFFGDDIL